MPHVSPAIAPQASAPAWRDSDPAIDARPLARRIAAQRELDFAGVKGSGPVGRIVKADVAPKPATLAAPAAPVSAGTGTKGRRHPGHPTRGHQAQRHAPHDRAPADLDIVTWRSFFAVNVDGAFLVTQAFVNDLRASSAGRVPDDIGPMIAALVGDANRWANAQRIEVSGGAYL